MKPAGLLKLLFYLFVIGLLANLLWEVAHSYLYDWNKLPLINDVYFYIPRIIKASIGDGFLIIAIYLTGLFKNKNTAWFFKMKKSDYFLVFLTGLIISAAIEIVNVSILHRWAYNPLMPLIPFTNIGLTPILQMILLPFLVFWAVKRLNGR